MNTASTAKDARETVREVREAASEASADMQGDLQKLREDFHRLADQVAGDCRQPRQRGMAARKVERRRRRCRCAGQRPRRRERGARGVRSFRRSNR